MANITHTFGAHDAPAWQAHWHLQSQSAHDVDDHAAHLTGWQQRYNQLSAGAFEGQLDELHTRVGQVYRERTSQALHQHCTVWPDAVWCGLTPTGPDGSRIEGREVGASGVMVCGQAGGFDLVTPAGHDLVGVVLDRPALEAHASALRTPLAWHLLEESPWLEVTPERHRLAAARLRAILSLAQNATPHHVTAVAARTSLHHAMLDVVTDLLQAPSAPEAPRSNATTRRRITRQVQQWVEQQPDVAPTIPELCQQLAVSRRTLQYAFEAEVGMSPAAYLRSIRLNGARRTLRSARADEESPVQQAAARWGFWNLSQFASDYRTHFGEKPSETVQRALHA